MDFFQIVAVLLTLAAVFSFVNHRYVGLPTTIGVMLIALLLSIALIGLHGVGVRIDETAAEILDRVDFDRTLLHGLLAFLLFAGALHVDVNDLAKQKLIIGALATVGVIVSTVIVAGLMWMILRAVGLPMSFPYCLVFGALISPTDPIAVLGLLKSANAPRTLEVKITGESLFNDGIGVVVFLVLLEFASGAHEVTARGVAVLFAQEAVGGALFGFASGLLAYAMLRSVNNYQVEVLITLALVTGTYALANSLHLSGPIAIVVAGLLIGNHGRTLAMSDTTREHLDTFWELTDEILNAVLFLLIGLEVLVLAFTGHYLMIASIAVPVVLFARFVSVGIPVAILRRVREFSPHVVTILTWGGLRGGISVALALSLPRSPEREVIVAVTYAVVVFSIAVQGLTIGPLIRRLRRPPY